MLVSAFDTMQGECIACVLGLFCAIMVSFPQLMHLLLYVVVHAYV